VQVLCTQIHVYDYHVSIKISVKTSSSQISKFGTMTIMTTFIEQKTKRRSMQDLEL
jgi:hypothetical protein